MQKSQPTSTTSLINQVVWITGASSGIGAALAEEFSKLGARVVLSARREDALSEVKRRCEQISDDPAKSFIVPLDITDEVSLSEKVSAVIAYAGRIDLLINNAGISQRSSCLNTDMQTYRTLFEVDVFGQIALTKLVLPIMVKQGSGHLAVTSSVAGKVGVPFRTGYCAAKHAMMGFFDALRAEVAEHGVKVTTITPGYIRTEISANAVVGDGSKFGKVDSDIKQGMSARDCAQTIVRGILKGKPEIAVGKGGEMHALWIKRWFPSLLFKLVGKQTAKFAQRDKFE